MKRMITCLLPFLISCGAMPTSDSNPKLINGAVVEAGPIVELSPTGCTATVVGSHTIITAGHCYKTGTKSNFTFKGKKYTATMERNPKYKDSGATNDHTFGYVADELPLPHARVNVLPVSVGDVVELQGYGCINPKTWFGGANGADHKLRRGAAKITSMSSLEFVTRGGAALCFGDSGGPVTLPNSLDVVGINSKGDIKTTSWLARLDTIDFMAFATNYMMKYNTPITGLDNH